MRIHELHIRETFADEIVSGNKTFEIRRNNRGYQRGDRIRFTALTEGEYRGVYDEVEHEINDQVYEITYVLNGWGLKEEYCVFSIKRIE